jgi:DNA-binding MurR/RpiR family transcriptional regulator
MQASVVARTRRLTYNQARLHDISETMTQSRKIVVHSLRGYHPEFATRVAAWLENGVTFIGIVGRDAARLEDVADDVAIGDGSHARFVLTSSHPEESLAEAVAFAEALTGEHAGPVEIVEF